MFQPKVSAKIFNFRQKNIWNNFINKIREKKEINALDFWEFREFYSPGYFQFNKANIEISSILQFYNLEKPKNDFLFFTSDKLKSTESIVNDKNYFTKENLNCTEIIFENDNSILCKTKTGEIRIRFIKTIEDMKKANGLFDYIKSENELLEGKFWLNETVIIP